MVSTSTAAVINNPSVRHGEAPYICYAFFPARFGCTFHDKNNSSSSAMRELKIMDDEQLLREMENGLRAFCGT